MKQKSQNDWRENELKKKTLKTLRIVMDEEKRKNM